MFGFGSIAKSRMQPVDWSSAGGYAEGDKRNFDTQVCHFRSHDGTTNLIEIKRRSALLQNFEESKPV